MSYEAWIFWLVVAIIAVGYLGYYSFALQVYFIILGGIFIVTGTILFIKYHKLSREIIAKKHEKLAKRVVKVKPEFRDRWELMRLAMRSNDLNELRVAMIDADTLIEELFREQGIEGDTMSALISEATFQGITGTDTVARFHRLRNRVVHESTFVPKPEDLRNILAALDQVLVRWGVVLPREEA